MNYLNTKKVDNKNKKKKDDISIRYKCFLMIVIILFCILIVRIAYLQSIKSSYLKEMAYQQLITNRIISTKRGTIYDSSGKPLALSAQVDTVSINPSKIQVNDNEQKTTQLKEKVAKGLSDIFKLDYQETLKKVNSPSSVETIIKKVEEDKIHELKKWMEDILFTIGIIIDEDTK